MSREKDRSYLTDELQFYIGLLQGLNRTLKARIGVHSAQKYLRNHPAELPDGFDIQMFDYVLMASLFVYAVSIFDVFLSDLTRDLLLRNIAALGKNCLVPIEVLASQKARNAIIRKEVERKVRNIAYKGFGERIATFDTLFGVSMELTPREQRELERIADIRNRLVHDQSSYHFRLDRRHKPVIQEKKNAEKPVRVDDKDLRKANNLFVAIGQRLVRRIEAKFLGSTALA